MLHPAPFVKRTLVSSSVFGEFSTLEGPSLHPTLGRNRAPAFLATLCPSAGLPLGTGGPVPGKAGRQGTHQQHPSALFSGAGKKAFSLEPRDNRASLRAESSSASSSLPGKGAGLREKACDLSKGSCQGSREADSLGLVLGSTAGLGGPRRGARGQWPRPALGGQSTTL